MVRSNNYLPVVVVGVVWRFKILGSSVCLQISNSWRWGTGRRSYKTNHRKIAMLQTVFIGWWYLIVYTDSFMYQYHSVLALWHYRFWISLTIHVSVLHITYSSHRELCTPAGTLSGPQIRPSGTGCTACCWWSWHCWRSLHSKWLSLQSRRCCL